MDTSLTHYASPLPDDLISVWRQVFERQRAFAEHAIGQLDLAGFFTVVAPGINSVAIIVNHMSGNMISRWSDFLTTDGEKNWRDRESEFLPPSQSPESRAEIIERWNRGWSALFAALEGLVPDDLSKVVMIRSVPHPVHAAIARQLDHYAFHVGQINVIARMVVGSDRWKWFTVRPGGSDEFNRSIGHSPRSQT